MSGSRDPAEDLRLADAALDDVQKILERFLAPAIPAEDEVMESLRESRRYLEKLLKDPIQAAPASSRKFDFVLKRTATAQNLIENTQDKFEELLKNSSLGKEIGSAERQQLIGEDGHFRIAHDRLRRFIEETYPVSELSKITRRISEEYLSIFRTTEDFFTSNVVGQVSKWISGRNPLMRIHELPDSLMRFVAGLTYLEQWLDKTAALLDLYARSPSYQSAKTIAALELDTRNFIGVWENIQTRMMQEKMRTIGEDLKEALKILERLHQVSAARLALGQSITAVRAVIERDMVRTRKDMYFDTEGDVENYKHILRAAEAALDNYHRPKSGHFLEGDDLAGKLLEVLRRVETELPKISDRPQAVSDFIKVVSRLLFENFHFASQRPIDPTAARLSLYESIGDVLEEAMFQLTRDAKELGLPEDALFSYAYYLFVPRFIEKEINATLRGANKNGLESDKTKIRALLRKINLIFVRLDEVQSRSEAYQKNRYVQRLEEALKALRMDLTQQLSGGSHEIFERIDPIAAIHEFLTPDLDSSEEGPFLRLYGRLTELGPGYDYAQIFEDIEKTLNAFLTFNEPPTEKRRLKLATKLELSIVPRLRELERRAVRESNPETARIMQKVEEALLSIIVYLRIGPKSEDGGKPIEHWRKAGDLIQRTLDAFDKAFPRRGDKEKAIRSSLAVANRILTELRRNESAGQAGDFESIRRRTGTILQLLQNALDGIRELVRPLPIENAQANGFRQSVVAENGYLEQARLAIRRAVEMLDPSSSAGVSGARLAFKTEGRRRELLLARHIQMTDEILNRFPKTGPSRSSHIQALLTLLYGGSAHYFYYETKNGKRRWTSKRFDDLVGLKKILRGDPQNDTQLGEIRIRADAAIAKLKDEFGIRADQKIRIPDSYSETGRPRFRFVTMGEILSTDPEFQNPFLHTFLGDSSVADGQRPMSRLERAFDFGVGHVIPFPQDTPEAAEEKAHQEAMRYLRTFESHFEPDLAVPAAGNEIHPFVIRVIHNTARGKPAKGGIRFVRAPLLASDEEFMKKFNLLSKQMNENELRYFLHKWVREETNALAAGMTTKAAVANLPLGGGKGAVLFADVKKKDGKFTIEDFTDGMNEAQALYVKADLLRRFVKMLYEAKRIGAKIDVPAPDAGSGAHDMDIMADELVRQTVASMGRRRFPKDLEEEFARIDAIYLKSPPGKAPLTKPLYLEAVARYLGQLRGTGASIPPSLTEIMDAVATFTSKSLSAEQDSLGSYFRPEATGYGVMYVLKEVVRKDKEFVEKARVNDFRNKLVVLVQNPRLSIGEAGQDSEFRDLLLRSSRTKEDWDTGLRDAGIRPRTLVSNALENENLSELLKRLSLIDESTPLKGMTAKIEGLGGVGYEAAKRLIREGVRIRAIKEMDGVAFSAKTDGFSEEDLNRLVRLQRDKKEKNGFKNIGSAKWKPNYPYFVSDALLISVDDFLSWETDIYLPSAKENSVTKHNVVQLEAKIVVEGANGAVTNDAFDALLKESRTIVIPDSLANAGGVIVSYFEMIQNKKNERWQEPLVIQLLEERLKTAIERLSVARNWVSKKHSTSWRLAADSIAAQAVLEALQLKSGARLSRNSDFYGDLAEVLVESSFQMNRAAQELGLPDVMDVRGRKIPTDIYELYSFPINFVQEQILKTLQRGESLFSEKKMKVFLEKTKIWLGRLYYVESLSTKYRDNEYFQRLKKRLEDFEDTLTRAIEGEMIPHEKVDINDNLDWFSSRSYPAFVENFNDLNLNYVPFHDMLTEVENSFEAFKVPDEERDAKWRTGLLDDLSRMTVPALRALEKRLADEPNPKAVKLVMKFEEMVLTMIAYLKIAAAPEDEREPGAEGARLASWSGWRKIFIRLEVFFKIIRFAWFSPKSSKIRIKMAGLSPYYDAWIRQTLFSRSDRYYAVAVNTEDDYEYEILSYPARGQRKSPKELQPLFDPDFHFISHLYPPIRFEPDLARYSRSENQIRRLQKKLLIDDHDRYKVTFHEFHPINYHALLERIEALQLKDKKTLTEAEIKELKEKEEILELSINANTNISALFRDEKWFPEGAQAVRDQFMVMGVYTDTRLLLPTFQVKYQYGLLRNSLTRPMAYVPIRYFAQLDERNKAEWDFAASVLRYSYDWQMKNLEFVKEGMKVRAFKEALDRFDKEWAKKNGLRRYRKYLLKLGWMHAVNRVKIFFLWLELRRDFGKFKQDARKIEKTGDLVTARSGISDYSQREIIGKLGHRAEELSSRARALGGSKMAIEISYWFHSFVSKLFGVDSGHLPMKEYAIFLRQLLRIGQYNESLKALYDLKRDILPMASGNKMALEPQERQMLSGIFQNSAQEEWMRQLFDEQELAIGRKNNRALIRDIKKETFRLFNLAVEEISKPAPQDQARGARLAQFKAPPSDDFFLSQLGEMLGPGLAKKMLVGSPGYIGGVAYPNFEDMLEERQIQIEDDLLKLRPYFIADTGKFEIYQDPEDITKVYKITKDRAWNMGLMQKLKFAANEIKILEHLFQINPQLETSHRISRVRAAGILGRRGRAWMQIEVWEDAHDLDQDSDYRTVWDHFSAKQKLILLIKLSRTIEAVHNAGALHNDLKPKNILLSFSFEDESWHITLIDFDVSLRMNEDGTPQYLLIGDMVGGTKGYKPVELDRRKYSDIYSFGKVLEELLPPGSLSGSTKNLYEKLLRKMTDTHTENRPQEMREVIFKLEAVDDALSQSAEIVSKPEKEAPYRDLLDAARLATAGLSNPPRAASKTKKSVINSLVNRFSKMDPSFRRWLRQADPEDLEIFDKILEGEPQILARLLDRYPERVTIEDEEGRGPDEGRTAYLSRLKKPFGEITHLRVKGSRPRTDASGQVRPYVGRAHVTNPLTARSGNIEEDLPSDSPMGALPRSGAILEEKYMLKEAAGEFETDYPVGYGIYPNKRYLGEPSAFVVAGMRGPDTRLNVTAVGQAKPRTRLVLHEYSASARRQRVLSSSAGAAVARQTGMAMASYHALRGAHRMPHLGNIGIRYENNKQPRVIFRDLETTRLRAEDDRQTQQLYRLLDVAIFLQELKVAPDSSDDSELVENFLKGYFPNLSRDAAALERLVQAATQAEPLIEISKSDRMVYLQPAAEFLLQAIKDKDEAAWGARLAAVKEQNVRPKEKIEPFSYARMLAMFFGASVVGLVILWIADKLEFFKADLGKEAGSQNMAPVEARKPIFSPRVEAPAEVADPVLRGYHDIVADYERAFDDYAAELFGADSRTRVASFRLAIGYIETGLHTRAQAGGGPAVAHEQIEPETIKTVIARSLRDESNASAKVLLQGLDSEARDRMKTLYRDIISERTKKISNLETTQRVIDLTADGAFTHKIVFLNMFHESLQHGIPIPPVGDAEAMTDAYLGMWRPGQFMRGRVKMKVWSLAPVYRPSEDIRRDQERLAQDLSDRMKFTSELDSVYAMLQSATNRVRGKKPNWSTADRLVNQAFDLLKAVEPRVSHYPQSLRDEIENLLKDARGQILTHQDAIKNRQIPRGARLADYAITGKNNGQLVEAIREGIHRGWVVTLQGPDRRYEVLEIRDDDSHIYKVRVIEGDSSRGGKGIVRALKIFVPGRKGSRAVRYGVVQRLVQKVATTPDLAHLKPVFLNPVPHPRQRFIEMDYVEGIQISDVPYAQWKAAMLSLAETVAFLHRHGVVHGDIQPANVMRSEDGSIRLFDFEDFGVISEKEDRVARFFDIKAIGDMLYEMWTERGVLIDISYLRATIKARGAGGIPWRPEDNFSQNMKTIIERAIFAGENGGYRSATELYKDLKLADSTPSGQQSTTSGARLADLAEARAKTVLQFPMHLAPSQNIPDKYTFDLNKIEHLWITYRIVGKSDKGEYEFNQLGLFGNATSLTPDQPGIEIIVRSDKFNQKIVERNAQFLRGVFSAYQEDAGGVLLTGESAASIERIQVKFLEDMKALNFDVKALSAPKGARLSEGRPSPEQAPSTGSGRAETARPPATERSTAPPGVPEAKASGLVLGNQFQKIRGTNDTDALERIQNQKVFISGDDIFDMSGDRTFENDVIFWVTTLGDLAGWAHDQGIAANQGQEFNDFRFSHEDTERRSGQDLDQLGQRIGGEDRRESAGQESVVNFAWGTPVEKGGYEDIGVNDDAHYDVLGAPFRTDGGFPSDSADFGQTFAATTLLGIPNGPVVSRYPVFWPGASWQPKSISPAVDWQGPRPAWVRDSLSLFAWDAPSTTLFLNKKYTMNVSGLQTSAARLSETKRSPELVEGPSPEQGAKRRVEAARLARSTPAAEGGLRSGQAEKSKLLSLVQRPSYSVTSRNFFRKDNRISKLERMLSPKRPSTALWGGRFKQAASTFLSSYPSNLILGMLMIGTYSMPLAVMISILRLGFEGSQPIASAISAGIVVTLAPVSSTILMILESLDPLKRTSTAIMADSVFKGNLAILKGYGVAFGEFIFRIRDVGETFAGNRLFVDFAPVRTVGQKTTGQRGGRSLIHLGYFDQEPLFAMLFSNLLNQLGWHLNPSLYSKYTTIFPPSRDTARLSEGRPSPELVEGPSRETRPLATERSTTPPGVPEAKASGLALSAGGSLKLEAGREEEKTSARFDGGQAFVEFFEVFFGGKGRLNSGNIRFDDGKVRFDDGKFRFDDGKVRFDDGKVRFDDGKFLFDSLNFLRQGGDGRFNHGYFSFNILQPSRYLRDLGNFLLHIFQTLAKLAKLTADFFENRAKFSVFRKLWTNGRFFGHAPILAKSSASVNPISAIYDPRSALNAARLANSERAGQRQQFLQRALNKLNSHSNGGDFLELILHFRETPGVEDILLEIGRARNLNQLNFRGMDVALKAAAYLEDHYEGLSVMAFQPRYSTTHQHGHVDLLIRHEDKPYLVEVKRVSIRKQRHYFFRNPQKRKYLAFRESLIAKGYPVGPIVVAVGTKQADWSGEEMSPDGIAFVVFDSKKKGGDTVTRSNKKILLSQAHGKISDWAKRPPLNVEELLKKGSFPQLPDGHRSTAVPVQVFPFVQKNPTLPSVSSVSAARLARSTPAAEGGLRSGQAEKSKLLSPNEAQSDGKIRGEGLLRGQKRPAGLGFSALGRSLLQLLRKDLNLMNPVSAGTDNGQTAFKLLLIHLLQEVFQQGQNFRYRQEKNSQKDDSAVSGGRKSFQVAEVQIFRDENVVFFLYQIINLMVIRRGPDIANVMNFVTFVLKPQTHGSGEIGVYQKFHRFLSGLSGQFSFIGQESGVKDTGLNVFLGNGAEFFNNLFKVHSRGQGFQNDVNRRASALHAGPTRADGRIDGNSLFQDSLNHGVDPSQKVYSSTLASSSAESEAGKMAKTTFSAARLAKATPSLVQSSEMSVESKSKISQSSRRVTGLLRNDNEGYPNRFTQLYNASGFDYEPLLDLKLLKGKEFNLLKRLAAAAFEAQEKPAPYLLENFTALLDFKKINGVQTATLYRWSEGENRLLAVGKHEFTAAEIEEGRAANDDYDQASQDELHAMAKAVAFSDSAQALKVISEEEAKARSVERLINQLISQKAVFLDETKVVFKIVNLDTVLKGKPEVYIQAYAAKFQAMRAAKDANGRQLHRFHFLSQNAGLLKQFYSDPLSLVEGFKFMYFSSFLEGQDQKDIYDEMIQSNLLPRDQVETLQNLGVGFIPIGSDEGMLPLDGAVKFTDFVAQLDLKDSSFQGFPEPLRQMMGNLMGIRPGLVDDKTLAEIYTKGTLSALQTFTDAYKHYRQLAIRPAPIDYKALGAYLRMITQVDIMA